MQTIAKEDRGSCGIRWFNYMDHLWIVTGDSISLWGVFFCKVYDARCSLYILYGVIAGLFLSDKTCSVVINLLWSTIYFFNPPPPSKCVNCTSFPIISFDYYFSKKSIYKNKTNHCDIKKKKEKFMRRLQPLHQHRFGCCQSEKLKPPQMSA